MVEACKISVVVIWHVKNNRFLIIIPFQINSTEYFIIPNDSDIVVFLNALIIWSEMCFPKILVPNLSTTRLNDVVCVK